MLLLPEAFDVHPTLIVERLDEVNTSDHLDRNAVAEFDDDLGHARALPCPAKSGIEWWRRSRTSRSNMLPFIRTMSSCLSRR